MTIKEKLNIVSILFRYPIKDKVTNKEIDYEDEEGYGRAYYIARFSAPYDTFVTSADMKYINTVCKHLIDIIGLPGDVWIDIPRILSKLSVPKDMTHDEYYKWIMAYFRLTDIYVTNKLISPDKAKYTQTPLS